MTRNQRIMIVLFALVLALAVMACSGISYSQDPQTVATTSALGTAMQSPPNVTPEPESTAAP